MSMTKQPDPVERGHKAIWWGVGAFWSLACVVWHVSTGLRGEPWNEQNTFWLLVWCFLASYSVLRVVRNVKG
jgi:hypothetical protein